MAGRTTHRALLGLALLSACSDLPTERRMADLAPSLAVASAAATCPSTWGVVRSAPGVVLCAKSFERNRSRTTDYLQVIDLKRGARITNVMEPESGAWAGGPSPMFKRRDLREWWSRYAGIPRLFCMANGAYFESVVGPSTQISFPLKNGGRLLTAGAKIWADRPRSVLILDGPYAYIQPYQLKSNKFYDVLNGLPWYTGIVGYSWDFAYALGGAHTLVAVRDADRDSRPEIVMIYTTVNGTPADVTYILSQLGAGRVMQFDGGASTQLQCPNVAVQSSGRGVPHIFATVAAPY
jgi:hypothetical protein